MTTDPPIPAKYLQWILPDTIERFCAHLGYTSGAYGVLTHPTYPTIILRRHDPSHAYGEHIGGIINQLSAALNQPTLNIYRQMVFKTYEPINLP